MRDDGFDGITPAHVNFIGSLDCGVTQSSEVARRLGVSRQAVHKMARELTSQGVIQLVPHPERGNQKVIRFTDNGAELISKMRRHLARMVADLEARLGDGGLAALERLLAEGWVSED